MMRVRIRRIEAKTGDRALDYLNQKESLLKEIEILVKNKDLKTGVKKIIDTNKKLEKQLLDFKNLNIQIQTCFNSHIISFSF